MEEEIKAILKAAKVEEIFTRRMDKERTKTGKMVKERTEETEVESKVRRKVVSKIDLSLMIVLIGVRNMLRDINFKLF